MPCRAIRQVDEGHVAQRGVPFPHVALALFLGADEEIVEDEAVVLLRSRIHHRERTFHDEDPR